MKRRDKRSYKKNTIIFFFILVLLSGAFILYRDSIPFSPSSDIRATPASRGFSYEDIRIQTPDGEILAGWYISADETSSGPGLGKTLLYFHGNGGNLSFYLEQLITLHKLGFSVCAIDYRGFGESTGQPSVKGTLVDASAAWHWLINKKNLTEQQIILYGHSLGGGVAATLAMEVRPAALILESTFTSLRDVAREHFPCLPAGLFLPDDYDTSGNLNKLAMAKVPLLILHSPEDEVISFQQGKSLYEGYQGPKRFVRLSGTHHGSFYERGDGYRAGLLIFFYRFEERRDAARQTVSNQ